jgi:hypothetical protein
VTSSYRGARQSPILSPMRLVVRSWNGSGAVRLQDLV